MKNGDFSKDCLLKPYVRGSSIGIYEGPMEARAGRANFSDKAGTWEQMDGKHTWQRRMYIGVERSCDEYSLLHAFAAEDYCKTSGQMTLRVGGVPFIAGVELAIAPYGLSLTYQPVTEVVQECSLFDRID